MAAAARVVVDAEADVVVTATDFEDAFRQLPELISAYFDARKLHVRSLLKIPTSNQPLLEPKEIVVGEASLSSNSLRSDALDLATCLHIPRAVLQEISSLWMGRHRTAPL